MVKRTPPLKNIQRTFWKLLFVGLWAVPSASGAKHDAVPDWVRSAANQSLPSYSSEANAVVLMEEINYSVAPSGQAVERVRRVVKILRSAGRDEGIVTVPFDKDTTLVSLHVWSIGPDGHEFAVKDDEIVEVGYPGQGNLYEDYKFKSVKAPGRDPGGIVAFEYEQQQRPYLNEKTWFFQENIPLRSASFTLELPAGYTYGAVWAHHDAAKAVDLEKQRWKWELKDISGIDLDHVLISIMY